MSALEQALGLAPGAGASEITKVVQGGNMTPEMMVAVRAADQKHAEMVAQQGLDLKKMNLDFSSHMVEADDTDRSSARMRESNVKDSTPKILAGVITLGFFSIIGLIAYVPMQADAKEPVLLLLGSLTTAWIAVVSYYFGSSSGAVRGQELLAQSGPVAGDKPIEVTSK